MPTAAQYGMSTPVGTDLIKEGDNEITRNANAAAVVFTRLEAGNIIPQPIPEGTNLDDLRTTGWYYVRLTNVAATITNRPPGIGDGPFMFRVVTTPFNQTTQTYYGYTGLAAGVYSRQTGNSTGTVFIQWVRQGGGGTVTGSGLAGIANMLRVQEFRDFYGKISTNGTGAIALRFDHGLTNFNSKIRPLLEARNLKYSLALSSRNFNAGENAGVTAAMVDSWGLAEVWNHGANSHLDQSSVAGLTDQIVTGKAELQAALPSKKIWGYAVPGTGGTGQGGFGGGDTPESFYTTGAGDLILTNHAVSTGAFPGTARRVMDGTVRQGQAHFTIEAQTVARIKTEIDQAILNRTGNQLMMHPSLLDTAGYITTAQLTEVLDYIVSKRSAGSLVVLSPYEMMVADARPGIKFSQAAGRTVTAWDYINNREQVIYGNTGLRDITAICPNVLSGKVYLQREGNGVTVYVSDVKLVTTGGFSHDIVPPNGLPVGFRPQLTFWFPTPAIGSQTAAGESRNLAISSTGWVPAYNSPKATDIYRCVMNVPTGDPWPTTLPGVGVGSIPA